MTTQPIRLTPREARPARVEPADRLVQLGPDACDDHELLSILLGSGGPSVRTARRLIERFGSLADVLRAHPAELRVAGISAAAAFRLAVTAELGRRAARAWPTEPWLIRTPADVADRLVDAMGLLDREELHVLILDTKNVVSAQRMVYRGNLAGSSVRVGEVFRDAVRACAAAIIVAHNHPSGDATPSAEDLRITAELAEAGRLLDIELLDHLIVGRGRWTSLRAVGALGQPPTIR
ncbi:MAG TPA: DNA repair protein RadC [Candidatus Limnocylindria bacterium]|nr:DNA repair protein RadC [Candidatus Limnocylindria bacterium]